MLLREREYDTIFPATCNAFLLLKMLISEKCLICKEQVHWQNAMKRVFAIYTSLKSIIALQAARKITSYYVPYGKCEFPVIIP